MKVFEKDNLKIQLADAFKNQLNGQKYKELVHQFLRNEESSKQSQLIKDKSTELIYLQDIIKDAWNEINESNTTQRLDNGTQFNEQFQALKSQLWSTVKPVLSENNEIQNQTTKNINELNDVKGQITQFYNFLVELNQTIDIIKNNEATSLYKEQVEGLIDQVVSQKDEVKKISQNQENVQGLKIGTKDVSKSDKQNRTSNQTISLLDKQNHKDLSKNNEMQMNNQQEQYQFDTVEIQEAPLKQNKPKSLLKKKIKVQLNSYLDEQLTQKQVVKNLLDQSDFFDQIEPSESILSPFSTFMQLSIKEKLLKNQM